MRFIIISIVFFLSINIMCVKGGRYNIHLFSDMLLEKYSKLEETRRLFEKFFKSQNLDALITALEEEQAKSLWSEIINSDSNYEKIKTANLFIKDLLSKASLPKIEPEKQNILIKKKYKIPFRWG